MDLFDLNKKGWCTPTILVTLSAVVMLISLLVQLVRANDNDERKRLSMASGSHLMWAVLVAWVMFYLCSHGKQEAAWWIFGLLYILPVIVIVLVLWKCSCRRRMAPRLVDTDEVVVEGDTDM